VRFGRRLGEHLQIDVGVAMLLMTALTTPVWNAPVVVTAQGEGTLPTASLAGSLVLAATPEIGVRYEF
jgi:hypothetical protein